MNARNIIIGTAVALALAIASLGCYTIIRHPAMQAEEQEYEDSTTIVDSESAEVGSYTHTTNDRDCMRCHQDFGQYPYGYYYNYYPQFYWDYPRWGEYYAYPWWWDSYWYKDKYRSGARVDTVDKVARPERQRGLQPPYVTGSDPINYPPPTFNSGNTTSPATGGSTGGTATGGTTGNTNPGNNTGNNNQNKKDEEKPPKRRGK